MSDVTVRVGAPATILPRRGELAPARAPRATGDRSGGGARTVVGALASSASMSFLLFGRLAPFSGVIGFVVVAFVLFITTYAYLVSLEDDGQVVRDRLVTVVLYSAALMLCAALAAVLAYIFYEGWSALVHFNFYTRDLTETGPKDGLKIGGMGHAIIGTFWIIAMALVITVPLGLVAAVYLNESRSRFSKFVRTIVEAMTALPSVVAGLFVFAGWILLLGNEKAALGGALAISIDMLPIIIRSADVILRLVPGSLREASAALGAPAWRSARYVVLPTARSGLATSVILGTARGIGETAPVLLTVGYAKATNWDPLHGPMVSLPLAAFELVRTGEPMLQARAFGAAALLLVIVLVLFVVARIIGGRGPGHLSNSQARRAIRASARDANRIISRYQRKENAT